MNRNVYVVKVDKWCLLSQQPLWPRDQCLQCSSGPAKRGIICEIRGVCHPSRRTDVFFISDIFWQRSGAMFWHLLMIVGSWRGQAGQAADTLQPLRLRTQFLLGAAGWHTLALRPRWYCNKLTWRPGNNVAVTLSSKTRTIIYFKSWKFDWNMFHIEWSFFIFSSNVPTRLNYNWRKTQYDRDDNCQLSYLGISISWGTMAMDKVWSHRPKKHKMAKQH